MLPFFWIPACAGMTICGLISITYKTGHTREGGYPGAEMTFCEFIIGAKNQDDRPLFTCFLKIIQLSII
jgi:hypothetical protein